MKNTPCATSIAHALAAVLFILAGCHRPQHDLHGMQFSDWYMAKPVPGARVAVAYGTIRNTGKTSRTIYGVKASCARNAQLHETIEAEGRLRMVRLTALEVSSAGLLVFRPGAKHLMLEDLDSDPGGHCRLVFLCDAGEAAFDVPVRKHPG